MNNNLEKIHQYLLKCGFKKEEILNLDTSPVYLAAEIAEYAHLNQKRENGEDYINHPIRCLNKYRELLGITPDDYFIGKDLIHVSNIPFPGVQELCLLHDVIEDTSFSLNDIRNIYIECGFKEYFDCYIKDALLCITHDKTIKYDEYIKKCLTNPIAAIVKMIDLQDNLHVLDLNEFNKAKYHRSQKYLYYIYLINKTYRFIENIDKYRKELKKLNGNKFCYACL